MWPAGPCIWPISFERNTCTKGKCDDGLRLCPRQFLRADAGRSGCRPQESRRGESVPREDFRRGGPLAALEKLLHIIGPGDVVLVTRLDRLARSTRDLLNILDKIGKAGCAVQIAARDLG